MASDDLNKLLSCNKKARLIPVTGISERSMTSVVLAAMAHVRPFADAVLISIGALDRGTLDQGDPLKAYTEIWFGKETGRKEGASVDGVIQIGSWTAIVESKIGKAGLDSAQMARYIQIAAECGVDCVISLSNQLVVHPTHIPYKLPDDLDRNGLGVALLHTSWASLRTTAEILLRSDGVLEAEPKYLLGEVAFYMDHAGRGSRQTKQVQFPSMRKSWPTLVDAAASADEWSPRSDAIESAVDSWHEVERQICLELKKLAGEEVSVGDSEKPVGDRRDATKQSLVSDRQLASTFSLGSGPGEITIVVDLGSLSMSAETTIGVPRNQTTAYRRIRWLTGELGDRSQHNKIDSTPIRRDIEVRALYTRRRKQVRSPHVPLSHVIENWRLLEVQEKGLTLGKFEIRLKTRRDKIVREPTKFSGRVWKLVRDYYDGVYQHIDK